LKNENGLRFGGHGRIVSLGNFGANSVNDDGATLEVWLEPGFIKGKATILAFDGAAHRGGPFTLYQNGRSLGIRRYNVDPRGTVRTAVFEVADVFESAKRVFVTVVLRNNVTLVYTDGVLSKVSEPIGDSPNNLSGRLVIGNAPSSDDSWTGNVVGLATHRIPFTLDQVKYHYQSWRADHVSADNGYGAAAIYRFSEHSGDIARNEVDSATNLTIPSRYFVLHLPLLEPAWRRQPYGWSYWQDVGINVAGFIPAGFFFLAYCSVVRPIKRPVMAVLLFGFALSLTIEVLQHFLPTRDSDMTDVITNTFGTAVGVALYRLPSAQRIWWRVAASMSPVLATPAREYAATDSKPVKSFGRIA